jgi:magnesium chelatase family protein
MTTTRSLVLFGLSPVAVRVTATLRRDAARRSEITITGIPEARVRDLRVRVGCALASFGICTRGGDFGMDVTVQPPIPPGASSSSLDLAIAVAIAGEIEPVPRAEEHVLLGELSLEGRLRRARGVLPMLRSLKGSVRPVVVPLEDRAEAAHAGVPAVYAESVSEVLRFLRGQAPLSNVGRAVHYELKDAVDMAEIRGHRDAQRVLEIAAAGGHSILLIGAPGADKIMLARRLPTLLPRMTHDEQIEVSSVLSSAGMLPLERGIATARPFRAPHHTVSAAGLVGGGEPVHAGEVTLAHHGVLFLDEVTEFRGEVLETALRAQREGEAPIVRRGGCTTFPARGLLVAAANACLCGFSGTERCTCTPEQQARHQARIDRVAPAVDMTLALQPAAKDAPRGESSAEIRARVVAARERQATRAKRLGIAPLNAGLSARDLQIVAKADSEGARAMAEAVELGHLTTADYGKVLRVARTVADLEGSAAVLGSHVVEALRYARTRMPRVQVPAAAPAAAESRTPSAASDTSRPAAGPVSEATAAAAPEPLSPAKKAWVTRRARQAAAAQAVSAQGAGLRA